METDYRRVYKSGLSDPNEIDAQELFTATYVAFIDRE